MSYGGDAAVGAYGIANRIAFIFFMVVMGINQGMQPIAGYNFGAQRMDRVMQVLKYAIAGGVAVMTLGWLVGELLPYPCARLFTSDPELIDMSINGIRINMAAFPLIGYQAVVTNFYQSIGRAKVSIFLSLSRQMLFLIPLVAILPPLFGIDGVWIALPASDVIAFVLTLAIMIYDLKKQKKKQ